MRGHLFSRARAPTPKQFRAGTHRWTTPADTVARAMRVSRTAGITRVANVTGLDVIGIPVVAVIRPNARSMAVSQGKGLDLEAARASGLMEAIESYHAEQIEAPLLLASYAGLRARRRVIDVARLPRVSVSSFDEDAKILWIEGHDLLNDNAVWLPYELVHTDYTLPLAPSSGALVMSSNGLASGNHLLEAITHGIHEIVERDATTLWSFQATQEHTRLQLSTIDDPACRAVLERYERAGITVAAWDTTTDVGIPSFQCTIHDRDPDPLRRLVAASGMGCHAAREIALLRALTEAAQARLTLIAGAREETGGTFYERARSPELLARISARIANERPTRCFTDVPTFGGDTFDADLLGSLDRLRAVGITEVVAIDLSRDDFGVPVVRVVIPGLETMHEVPGYVPGVRARALLPAREGTSV